jgi:hypothetical protein
LCHEVSAQALSTIVDGVGRALQVVRSGEPDQTVPEILALRQEKDDKYDDKSRRGERIH